MQKVGAVLGNLDRNLGRVMKVRRRWPEIAGELLAQHTDPVQIKGKKLLLVCDSPAWVQQVGILEAQLLPRIREITGVRLGGLDAKFGVANAAPEIKALRPKPYVPQIDPADIARIKSPKLKEIFEDMTKENKDA